MNFKADIGTHLYSLSLELEPTDDADENRRRHDILVDAGKHALAAAAESVDGEPSAPRKRAILAAMMTYGRARLSGETAEFRVERSSNGKLASAPSWMIAMMHQAILEQLQAGWDKAPVRPVTGDRFVSDDGRFGDAQLRGIQRRFETEKKRIETIQRAARDLVEKGLPILPSYDVSAEKARAWLRKRKKPSAIADELLADYINTVAQNRDEIVEQYNRGVEEFVEHRNRDLEQGVGKNPPDKKVAEPPQSLDAEDLKIDPSARTELKPNLTRRWVKSKAQQGREKLVHLQLQDEGLKRREISQMLSTARDKPDADQSE